MTLATTTRKSNQYMDSSTLVSDQTLMASQREPCHESLGLSQQVSRTIALSKFDGSLMVVTKALHSAFACILPVCIVIMHFFLQISSPGEGFFFCPIFSVLAVSFRELWLRSRYISPNNLSLAPFSLGYIFFWIVGSLKLIICKSGIFPTQIYNGRVNTGGVDRG
jgi:hypothetical protein